jgi:hypothetical protein
MLDIDSYKPKNVMVGWGLDLENSSIIFPAPKPISK